MTLKFSALNILILIFLNRILDFYFLDFSIAWNSFIIIIIIIIIIIVISSFLGIF